MKRLRLLGSVLVFALLLTAGAAAASDPISTRERNALVTLYHATRGERWRHNERWLGPPGTECDWFGITCQAPDLPGGPPQVAFIHLQFNLLRGSVPRQLGKLVKLLELNLSHNQLEGPIPAELGALRRLRFFDLSDNQLSGPIPCELGNLRGLGWFNLAVNRLTGVPPQELAELKNVELFAFAFNRLSGNVPAWLDELTSVSQLVPCPNDFTGPIPAEIFRPGNLSELYLSDCHLTGRIPDKIGEASRLSTIFLQGNQLSGEIPASMTRVDRLSNIQLDWNAIHTDNEALVAFIDSRTNSLAWRETQTLPPADASAEATGATTIRLSWTPVNYNPAFFNANGGYTVYASTGPGGPFAPIKTVQGKPSREAQVTGLRPGTTYYFRIDTFSLPHRENPNVVHSQRTTILSATTDGTGH